MAAREKSVELEEVTAEFARAWWKSLMANATALIEDAAVLADHSSPGRAQALLVLAMEELAKARWIYDVAQWEWSAPLGLYGQAPRASRPIIVPDQLTARRLPHLDKVAATEQFASGLEGFWNADRRHEYYFPADLTAFEGAARRRNLDKQAGFYVDRVDDTLLTPLAITTDGVVDFLMYAALCVEMHLIEDHTRQQDAPNYSLVDSVQDLHWVVLPYAHLDDLTAFFERVNGQQGAPESDDSHNDPGRPPRTALEPARRTAAILSTGGRSPLGQKLRDWLQRSDAPLAVPVTARAPWSTRQGTSRGVLLLCGERSLSASPQPSAFRISARLRADPSDRARMSGLSANSARRQERASSTARFALSAIV